MVQTTWAKEMHLVSLKSKIRSEDKNLLLPTMTTTSAVSPVFLWLNMSECPACDVTSFPADQRRVSRRPRRPHTETLIERKEWYAGTINIHHFKSLYCQRRQCVRRHQSGVASLPSALCDISTCPECRFKRPPHARACQSYQRSIEEEERLRGRTSPLPADRTTSAVRPLHNCH